MGAFASRLSPLAHFFTACRLSWENSGFDSSRSNARLSSFIDRIFDEEKSIYFHSLLHSFRELVPFLLSHAIMDRERISEFTKLVRKRGDGGIATRM